MATSSGTAHDRNLSQIGTLPQSFATQQSRRPNLPRKAVADSVSRLYYSDAIRRMGATQRLQKEVRKFSRVPSSGRKSSPGPKLNSRRNRLSQPQIAIEKGAPPLPLPFAANPALNKYSRESLVTLLSRALMLVTPERTPDSGKRRSKSKSVSGTAKSQPRSCPRQVLTIFPTEVPATSMTEIEESIRRIQHLQAVGVSQCLGELSMLNDRRPNKLYKEMLDSVAKNIDFRDPPASKRNRNKSLGRDGVCGRTVWSGGDH